MHPLVKLAKEAVETYIKSGKTISIPKDFPKDLIKIRAGVFVTIEKEGILKGCIGTYLPTRLNIAEETIKNAIAAATEDWRFEPIKEKDLPFLKYTVSVLSWPEEVKDKKELDPKKYGVLVKTFPFVFPNKNYVLDGLLEKEIVSKTGILLPDIEGVETVEKQISIVCQKAGIDPEREKFFIYKFRVKKYQ